MVIQKISSAGWLAATAGVVLLAGLSGPASAGSSSASLWRGERASAVNDQRPGPVRMADGRICERICAHDNIPCDPINFKIADGRCNGRMSSPR